MEVFMKISSDIKPITYLKTNAAALLDQINETHRPVVITQNGEPKGIAGSSKLRKYEECIGSVEINFSRRRRY